MREPGVDSLNDITNGQDVRIAGYQVVRDLYATSGALDSRRFKPKTLHVCHPSGRNQQGVTANLDASLDLDLGPVLGQVTKS